MFFQLRSLSIMNSTCDHCPKRELSTSKKMGAASWLLLAILPKCPFCIMAFTSTALLCGEGAMQEVSMTHNSMLTISITSLLLLVTLASVLINYKGKTTWWALSFILPGLTLVMYSVVRDGGQLLYYTGTVLTFAGVWMNGSLPWLLRKNKMPLPVLSTSPQNHLLNPDSDSSEPRRSGY